MHRNLMHLLAEAFAGAKRVVKYGSVVFKEYLFNIFFCCKITFDCEYICNPSKINITLIADVDVK